MKERIRRDQLGLLLAAAWAQRSTCARKKVGCVLWDANGRELATGYNGPASGERHCSRETPCPGADAPSGTGLEKCEAIHAEANALMRCADVTKIHTAYVTHSPCLHCVKLLMNTGCRRIVFIHPYAHDEPARKLWERTYSFPPSNPANRTWEKINVEQWTLQTITPGIPAEASEQRLRDHAWIVLQSFKNRPRAMTMFEASARALAEKVLPENQVSNHQLDADVPAGAREERLREILEFGGQPRNVEEEALRWLATAYRGAESDAPQYTRWNMAVAYAAGKAQGISEPNPTRRLAPKFVPVSEETLRRLKELEAVAHQPVDWNAEFEAIYKRIEALEKINGKM